MWTLLIMEYHFHFFVGTRFNSLLRQRGSWHCILLRRPSGWSLRGTKEEEAIIAMHSLCCNVKQVSSMNHPRLTLSQSHLIIFIGKLQTSSTSFVLSKSEISQTHKDNSSAFKVNQKKKKEKKVQR